MQRINLMAPINPLGYGVVGFNVTKELSKTNEVSLFPIGNPEVATQEEADVIKSCIQNQQIFESKSPCLRIWHQFAMAEQIGNGLRCGFPIFELDTFNENEKYHLDSLEKIFVCSQWAKEVIVNSIKATIIDLNRDNQLDSDKYWKFKWFEQPSIHGRGSWTFTFSLPYMTWYNNIFN